MTYARVDMSGLEYQLVPKTSGVGTSKLPSRRGTKEVERVKLLL